MNGEQQRYLSPALLQGVGLALLIAAFVLWALTGQESVLMVSSAMTLIGAGAYRGATRTLERAEERVRNRVER